MEQNEKRRPSKGVRMKDAVFIQYTAELVSHDSPEFQEQAKLPLSARGPNLALYLEEQKAKDKQSQT